MRKEVTIGVDLFYMFLSWIDTASTQSLLPFCGAKLAAALQLTSLTRVNNDLFLLRALNHSCGWSW